MYLIKGVNIMAYIITDACTACGECIEECAFDAIVEGDIYSIDADLCTDCAACEGVCAVEAIHAD